MPADDHVVAAAKSGDPEAWRELYRQHAGRLLNWLQLRPVTDASLTADDIASETWLVAASTVADYQGVSRDFGGWLFGIARKVGTTAQRTAARRATVPAEAPGELVPQVVPDLSDEHERLMGVRGVLEVLSPSERDAIALVDCLGVPAKEAAAALGVSGVSLRVARHRGLKRLKATPNAWLTDLLREPS